jgi:6-pyruvoyltetrahydropterin/6-carboxytetrahydropterin synthase
MYELAITGDFAASHMLAGYEGNCKNLHGHTWKVEAFLESSRLDSIGMVMDFKLAKKKLKDVLTRLDHVHLNDLAVFAHVNPTTENLAKYIFEEFSKECGPFKVKRVRVWESDSASITYCP